MAIEEDHDKADRGRVMLAVKKEVQKSKCSPKSDPLYVHHNLLIIFTMILCDSDTTGHTSRKI